MYSQSLRLKVKLKNKSVSEMPTPKASDIECSPQEELTMENVADESLTLLITHLKDVDVSTLLKSKGEWRVGF